MRNQTTNYIKEQLFNELKRNVQDCLDGWSCQSLMLEINNQLHTIHKHEFDLTREFEELVLIAKRELIKYRNQYHWDTDIIITYTALNLRFERVELPTQPTDEQPTEKPTILPYKLNNNHIEEYLQAKSVDNLSYIPSKTTLEILRAIKSQKGIRSKVTLRELERISTNCYSNVHNGAKGTSIYTFNFLGYKVKSTPLMSF